MFSRSITHKAYEIEMHAQSVFFIPNQLVDATDEEGGGRGHEISARGVEDRAGGEQNRGGRQQKHVRRSDVRWQKHAGRLDEKCQRSRREEGIAQGIFNEFVRSMVESR